MFILDKPFLFILDDGLHGILEQPTHKFRRQEVVIINDFTQNDPVGLVIQSLLQICSLHHHSLCILVSKTELLGQLALKQRCTTCDGSKQTLHLYSISQVRKEYPGSIEIYLSDYALSAATSKVTSVVLWQLDNISKSNEGRLFRHEREQSSFKVCG